MTRDDIIRLAREAGWHDELLSVSFTEPLLERFAALVAAAEREKIAQWMIERSYATGHGDTVEDLLKELEWQIREREREDCAKLCEENLRDEYLRQDRPIQEEVMLLTAIADCVTAIRARGEA